MTSVRRGLRLAIPAVLCLALTAAPGLTQGPPAASPESVGLSSERLERVDRVMKEYVDQGRIPGVVTLIARHGKVAQFQGYGKLDLEKNAPMQKDTIFRIASMSKAVTSIAALMLLEDGKLLLSDPVSKFIPAYKNTTVAVAPPAGAAPNSPVAKVPAKREITIRDLLTHTSGVSYGSGPAEAQYKAADIWMWYFADKNEPILPVIERLASLPFDAQPGEKYIYGFNTDILGAVVEKASGMPLDEFFRTRIFEPLKMVDTSFFLPPAKADRLAAVYGAKEGARRPPAAQPENGGACDIESRGHALQRGPNGLRPGVRDGGARGPLRPAGLGWRIQLGRGVLHELLGRSPGADRGGVHVADAAGREPRSAGQVPRPRVSVGRRTSHGDARDDNPADDEHDALTRAEG
jgi:CubicO group peptidase (beta-lactamase class C family)